MGKEKSVKKINKNTIQKSLVLKYLSYLMMFVAFMQIVVVGLQVVYFYKMNKIGHPYSWFVMLNETVLFVFISMFEMLMGVYGIKGAAGDRYSLKTCRFFSILAVATTTVYVGIAVYTKSEEPLRLVSQFIFPLAYYFATFIPNFKSQMEKDVAKANAKKVNNEIKTKSTKK